VDYYRFTSALRELSQEERLEIIRMMWQVGFADGKNHELEDNMVWRIAELIGGSARGRTTLRKQMSRRPETILSAESQLTPTFSLASPRRRQSPLWQSGTGDSDERQNRFLPRRLGSVPAGWPGPRPVRRRPLFQEPAQDRLRLCRRQIFE